MLIFSSGVAWQALSNQGSWNTSVRLNRDKSLESRNLSHKGPALFFLLTSSNRSVQRMLLMTRTKRNILLPFVPIMLAMVWKKKIQICSSLALQLERKKCCWSQEQRLRSPQETGKWNREIILYSVALTKVFRDYLHRKPIIKQTRTSVQRSVTISNSPFPHPNEHKRNEPWGNWRGFPWLSSEAIQKGSSTFPASPRQAALGLCSPGCWGGGSAVQHTRPHQRPYHQRKWA